MKTQTLKTLTIIPNDDILNVPVYYNNSYLLYHYQLASGFSAKYNLPYIGGNNDLDIPRDGHILLKSLDNNDYLLGFIKTPITERQYEYLLSLKDYLSSFYYYAFNIEGEANKHIYSRHSNDKDTLDYLYEELKKYIKYKKR